MISLCDVFVDLRAGMAARPTLVARIPETGTRNCVRKRRCAGVASGVFILD